MKKLNTTLSPELEALLEGARPIQDLDLTSLTQSIFDLESSPAHVAETRKAAFVEDVLRALDDQGISKSELARRLGKSRQQLNIMLDEEKRNNFTIETMAKISTTLGRKLVVRMLASETDIQLNRNIITQTSQMPAELRHRDWSGKLGAISSRELIQVKASVEEKHYNNLISFNFAA